MMGRVSFLMFACPFSPRVAQEFCFFPFFSPDQPLSEGGVNKHPGAIPPLHKEDRQVIYTLLEILPVQGALSPQTWSQC